MRAKRAKQYRKLINAYALSFGFRSPLQILLDADFIRAAARYKMNLGNMLQSTFSGYEIKPMITQCCIRHLYNAPTTTDAERREKAAWIEVAKQAERRRCGHHEMEEPLSTLDCLESVVDGKDNGTNKHRYIIATQDPEVRAQMRTISGVPLVYINRSVMILEPMSTASDKARQADERGKVRAGLLGRRGGAAVEMKRKREADDDDARADVADADADANADAPAQKRKRVKGPKGPNPLSVKKAGADKAKKQQQQSQQQQQQQPQQPQQKSTAPGPTNGHATVRKPREPDTPLDNDPRDSAEGVMARTEAQTSEPRKRKRKRKSQGLARVDGSVGKENGGNDVYESSRDMVDTSS